MGLKKMFFLSSAVSAGNSAEPIPQPEPFRLQPVFPGVYRSAVQNALSVTFRSTPAGRNDSGCGSGSAGFATEILPSSASYADKGFRLWFRPSRFPRRIFRLQTRFNFGWLTFCRNPLLRFRKRLVSPHTINTPSSTLNQPGILF